MAAAVKQGASACITKDVPTFVKSKCLVCNECVPCGDEQIQNAVKELSRKANGAYNSCGDDNGTDLKSQLSIFFLMRKVFGLSTEFLESLLVNCGSPYQWNVKLCRFCKRLFKEAEHLWDRMSQLRRDYEKVTFEIKDALINSISPDEVECLKESEEATKKSVVEEKIKSSQVAKSVRLKFFMDLENEQDDAEPESSQTPVLSGLLRTTSNFGKQTGMLWNEKGVPLLSLADFEYKMKQLVETVTSCSKIEESSPKSSSLDHQSKVQNLTGVKEHKSFETEVEQISRLNKCSKSLSNIQPDNAMQNTKPLLTSHALNTEEKDEEEEEPLIRIVQTSSLMEPDNDDDEDEDNPAVSHVLAVINSDFDNDSVDVSSNDPLTPDLRMDDDDPDYSPEHEMTIAAIDSHAKKSTSSKRTKIRFNSRKIKVFKKASNIYECLKCFATFEARLGCQVHIFRDHYDEKLPFHCHLCNETFFAYQSLREHICSTHESSTTAYDDDFDPGETLKQLKLKDQGPSSNHTSNIPIYQCPHTECSDQFTNKQDLQKHINSAHGVPITNRIATKRPKKPIKTKCVEPPGLECEICTKRGIEYRAPTKDILDIHYKKVHNGYIDLRARIKDKIANQMKSKSLDSKSKSPRSIKCPDCGKLEQGCAAMAEHLKNPPNKCAECRKHFLFETELKRHQDLEHYNRSFQCPYCASSFNSMTIYEKHVQNHQLHCVHECEVCHVKFTGRATLTRHITVAHPEYNAQQQQEVKPKVRQNPEILGL